MIALTRYGRLDGAIYQATVWYEPTDDPHGIELPGYEGRWRIAAATTLPDGAEPVSEPDAVAELRAFAAAHEAWAEQQRAEITAQRQADVGALEAAGLPADLAQRLASRLGVI